MWSLLKPLPILAAAMTAFVAPAAAKDDGRRLTSTSLNPCPGQDSSGFEAQLFEVLVTPWNASATARVIATSSVEGRVKFDVRADAYGYEFIKTTFDPCDKTSALGEGLAGLCPMTSGKMDFKFKLPIDKEAFKNIPGIAYGVPDLDSTVRVYINLTSTQEAVACVEASISNGKTVNLIGVKWATAIIAGLGLISSGIVSGLGHSNAAAHVASSALSLFSFFQAQAIVGLTSVELPPIVSAWTQDFQWSMGIIRVGFIQDICTWYQRATGGKAASILSVVDASIQVQKRGLEAADTGLSLFKRALAMAPVASTSLAKRSNIQTDNGGYIVYGIQRVAYKARIESTNLFMTGLIFLIVFYLLTVLATFAFKGFCELAARQKWIAGDKFLEFRNGWMTVLKGILFRVTLIGFPQMTILCLWEFTQRDSSAEVVLAVFFFFGMAFVLGYGAWKVITIARRSVAMHRNPAYILFSDPQALNKWGFLYVQFRASAYYYVVPVLAYIIIKGMFVALAQHNPIVIVIGFLICDAGALIAASVLRPWMDKSTNSFNIAIYAMNFVNAIFLLIFDNVFGMPKFGIGICGVLLFVINAVFATVLLIMVLVSTAFVFFRKNPDARYQFMADDRASFMKSQTQLNTTTELDALAATARGDKGGYGKSHMDLDEDDSLSSEDMRRRHEMANRSQASFHHDAAPRSPINPSMPLFPAGQRPESPFRTASPASFQQQPGGSSYNQSTSSLPQQRMQNNASPGAGYRSQNNASPWQRGAGYEH